MAPSYDSHRAEVEGSAGRTDGLHFRPMPTLIRAGWVMVFLLACCISSKSAAQSPPRPVAPAIKPVPITVAKAEARPVQRMVETIGSLVAWDETQVKTEQPG